MMSSNGFPAFDGLTEQYDEDWLFGLEDDTLKCSSSPPPNAAADMALSVPVRTCPSPLSQIPTREPFPSEAPPKLSPVPCEQQTFITLSNHVPPPQGAPSSQQLMQPTPSTSNTQPAELNPLEYELCGTEVTMVPVQSTSPVIIAKQAIDVHMVQPSTSGLQHNGTLVQQPAGCLQTVNGQWFVQAQVQHVQTSGGTVIAVVPNFCRTQGTPVAQATIATQSPQQLVASIGAQPTQHVMHSQTPQHQTVVHTSRASNTALSVNVVSANTQQTHSVMQHLLSQPTLARQQASSSTTMSNVVTPKPKQRAPQSRANGRKKNAAQGGTLGAVLAKANKLAAASSTDASLNQILPPSQGIEMRLSVQNSEQVANLSKEISRLQNLQATYNVDHSAEIKDLENKRAQIFFEALAQQHKDKDLLSAVNVQPSVTVSTSSRQRNNYSRQHHPPQQRVVVQHQSQPSTSCEQPLVMYEAAPNPQTQESPLNYQPYQVSQYPSTSQALQRNSYDSRVNQVQVAQTPVVQQYTYTANEPQMTSVCSSYMGEHAQTSVSQANVVLQAASPCTTNMQSVLVSGPTEAVVPPSPLYPPPDLPTSADIASAVSDKRQRRTQRLHDYFEQLRRLVQYADTTSPFRDLFDALNRLLPFHVYHEPELNNAIIDRFDDDCLRHFVHLTERKNRVEHRLRTILYNEAMRDADSSEQCLLLSMEGEYERRKLDEERSEAANDIEAFVANSTLCAQLSEEQLQSAKKEFDSRKPASPLKQHIHFDYHPFSEEELLARCISPMPDSDPESPSSFEQEEESLNSDANEELCDVKQEPKGQEEASEIETKLSDVKVACSNVSERASGMAGVAGQTVYTGVAITTSTGQHVASSSSSSSHKGEVKNDDDWIESSPSPELTPATLGAAALPKVFPVKNEEANVTTNENWIEQPTSYPAEHDKSASLLWRRSSPRSLSRRDSQVCSPNYAASSPVVRHSSSAGSIALTQAGSQRSRGVVLPKQLPEPQGELIRPQIRQDSRPFRKRKFPSTQPVHDSFPLSVEESPSVSRSEEVQLRSRKCGTPSSQPRQKREPPLLARKRQLHSSQMCDLAIAPSVRSSPTLSHDGVVRSSPIAFPVTSSSSFSSAKVELSSPSSRDETRSPQTRQESNRIRLQNVSPELPLRSLSTQIESSERTITHNDENSASIERQSYPTVAYHATVHAPLENAPNGVQKETPQSEGRIETRPPIKIKIALMDASLRKRGDDGDTKRRKERKKDKKRKHHTHHSHNENHESACKLETNGMLASCSNEMHTDNLSAQLVASTLDDPSHSRILMRISRKKNCSTPEPTCSAPSRQLSGGERRVDTIVSEPVLPPRIPKLKIRIGRSDVSEEGRVTRVNRTDEGKEPACQLDEKHSFSARQPTKSPSRSEDVPNLHASSCAPSDDVQFSPQSEASDEEADQQLRAQTDTVISQLSGWGPSLPLSHNPAETFSRLVGSSPLVNPLLGALMPLPSAPWLLNAANLNHAAAGIAAAQSLPWLIPPSALMQQAATAQPRKLSSAATAPLDNPR